MRRALLYLLAAWSACVVAASAAAAADAQWWSACASPGTGWRALELRAGRQPECLAWSWFSDDIETTGWARLVVETNAAFDDQSQAYAAGWLEAALTRARIYQVRLFHLIDDQITDVIAQQSFLLSTLIHCT